ncbi:MAG TPA: carboxypeptidase-like regulatory domain-containing protein, partial [Terriglobales bacterium]
MRLRWGFVLFLLLIPAVLIAQTFRGTILGTVTDSQGAVVAGAKVTVRNTNTGLERTTETSADGSYAVPELPIGTYTVTISQTGFQTAVTRNVPVDVAAEKRVDATLKAGEVSTVVEVSGEALPQVETASNTLGGQFESKQIADLPINGRDFTKMLIMVPGAAGEPNGGGDSPGSYGLFSANGSRGRANNFLLDGTDMNDGYRNLPAINQGGVFGTPGTVLPLDSVAELKVLSNFEAEYGRNSGAVVNIVTKSGTNTVHGTAYEDFRNAVLDSRNYFNSSGLKDAFRNNQYGGAVGGPIVKDKTFFYLAYEGQREGLAITSLNLVPTLNGSPSSGASNENDYFQAISVIPGGDPSQCTTSIIACIQNQPSGVINPVILNLFNFCASTGKCSGGTNIWPLANIPNPSLGAANSADAASAYN